MTTTPELLDAAKAKMGLTSDYALAKALNWPVGTVSNYRRGVRAMDIEQAAEFNERTGIALEIIVKIAVDDRRRLKSGKRGEPIQTALKLSATM